MLTYGSCQHTSSGRHSKLSQLFILHSTNSRETNYQRLCSGDIVTKRHRRRKDVVTVQQLSVCLRTRHKQRRLTRTRLSGLSFMCLHCLLVLEPLIVPCSTEVESVIGHLFMPVFSAWTGSESVRSCPSRIWVQAGSLHSVCDRQQRIESPCGLSCITIRLHVSGC